MREANVSHGLGYAEIEDEKKRFDVRLYFLFGYPYGDRILEAHLEGDFKYLSCLNIVAVQDMGAPLASKSGDSCLSSTREALQTCCTEWLTRCQNCHDCCRSSSSTSFIPTRLVDVRGHPRVSVLDNCDNLDKYATLSHCCMFPRYIFFFSKKQN